MSSRSQLIYINSKNRQKGFPYDFYINIDNDLIKLTGGGITGKIKLSVVEATLNRSWYSVQDNNNTFFVNGVLYTIPIGYYNVFTLKDALEELLPTWTITYNKRTHQYTFRPPNDMNTYLFYFNNPACFLLGFNITDAPSGTYNFPIISTIPVKVNYDETVLVRCDMPKVRYSVIDNVNNSAFVESDIIVKIPINAPPFDNIIYQATTDNVNSIELSAFQLHNLRFYTTNENGRLLKLPYDWGMTLRLEYYEENTDMARLIKIMSDVKDYARYILLNDIAKEI